MSTEDILLLIDRRIADNLTMLDDTKDPVAAAIIKGSSVELMILKKLIQEG